jgi:hypothetical protein
VAEGKKKRKKEKGKKKHNARISSNHQFMVSPLPYPAVPKARGRKVIGDLLEVGRHDFPYLR